MKKCFVKIRKTAMEMANVIMMEKNYKDMAEDDLDILAEAIDILNDIYEELYDKVFVETDTKTVCKGTADQL